jgi:hypothetical protein
MVEDTVVQALLSYVEPKLLRVSFVLECHINGSGCILQRPLSST